MKVKKFLNYVIQDILEPIRQRRKEFEKDIPGVYKILFEGTDKARRECQKTLEKVKKAIGLDYRNNQELINSQQQKYNS